MERLGRYQVREIIGEGAMARVYKAYDPEIDRTIAIKLLKPQFGENDQYRARFLREARAAGVLSHPNIVTIFDVGVDESRPYIAMEMIDGLTLGDVLRTDRKLTFREVVEIGIQLTRALDYAHRKGIVHRDVKPGNIMLIEESKTIKVADFGICRMDNAGNEETQHTQMGDVLGTPNYMSPEQVNGEKVDARSDLFSAGVVLYKLLMGVVPFDGDSVITVAYKIAKTDPPPMDKMRPEIPASLRRIVERSLKKQPDKRFQTGEEFAQALIGVARELSEEETKKGSGRGIPLGIRWALMMAALVAVTMTLTATVLYQKQYQAMLAQVEGYGGSLAKLIATQNAVPLLSEDWAQIDVFIQETLSRQDFNYIRVVDHTGMIRGSNVAGEVNQKYEPPLAAKPIPASDTEVNVQGNRLADGRNVLDFGVPILFQGKEIGHVHLGIYEAPLSAVANLMLALLGILTLVTSAAVAGGTYLLARRLSGPLRLLRNSLDELAQGRYDYRIADKRTDELGELYAVFDRTAEALEKRHDPSQPASAPAAGALDDPTKADATAQKQS
jgi:eukaryotic-like serine/threonine-protein kinase